MMADREKKFQLGGFLPYMLNQAAEATSQGFQSVYRRRYEMTRTEWRVLAHLGEFGEMTAKEICERSALHKTEVSRAVLALEKKRWLVRSKDEQDRRAEQLLLSAMGVQAYNRLTLEAENHNDDLVKGVSAEEMETFVAVLETLKRNSGKLN